MKPARFRYTGRACGRASIVITPNGGGGPVFWQADRVSFLQWRCRDARPSPVVDIMGCSDLAELATEEGLLVIGVRCRQGTSSVLNCDPMPSTKSRPKAAFR